jgi:hypothetical protein
VAFKKLSSPLEWSLSPKSLRDFLPLTLFTSSFKNAKSWILSAAASPKIKIQKNQDLLQVSKT